MIVYHVYSYTVLYAHLIIILWLFILATRPPVLSPNLYMYKKTHKFLYQARLCLLLHVWFSRVALVCGECLGVVRLR